MRWAAHEPPVLVDAANRNVAQIDPLRHDETERAGLVFQHYAYATLPQVRFKQTYYGYRGAVAGWAELQFAPLPCRLADYFQWVRDETRVDRADKLATPLVDLKRGEQSSKPLVVIDGFFFQYAASGIARVWWSLLTEWSRTDFAKNIVLIDRAGTMPPIENIRTRLAPLHRYDCGDRERDILQQICDEEGAAVFVSTYYSIPRTTPSLLMIHDMIPEVFGWDMSGYMGLAKVAAIPYASAFVAVSENSKRDLLRFYPSIDESRVTVTPCGVWPNVFRPVEPARVEAFGTKYNFNGRPYFLYVGDRAEYKNGGLLLRALAQLPNAGDHQVVFTGGAPGFEAELTPLLAALPSTTVVRVVGRLADEDLAAAYSGAAALVVTSFYEGFGLPIVEAMACGCPVITTDAGSTREVAGGAAIFVLQNDPAALAAAMVRVQDPAERTRLIAAGVENAKRYRWDAMAAGVRAAIEKTAFMPGPSMAK
jgi:glycosyltransferase involved in cell wall biosynthesis